MFEEQKAKMYQIAAEKAAARKEQEWAEMRCGECGEQLKEEPRAEVVLKVDAEWAFARHLIVHQEPCALKEKFVLA